MDTTTIRKALNKAGYHHVPPTVQELKRCFVDYVDSGHWSNITLDDVDDFTVEEMTWALLRMRG